MATIGVVMTAVGWSPRTIYDGIIRFVQNLWNLGFDAIYSTLEFLLLGAAIVFPAFFLIWLVRFFRSSRG